MLMQRPHTIAIFAQSLDGKLSAGVDRRPHFPSGSDSVHLQRQVASCEAVVMGGETLRAYGTSVRLQDPQLIDQRLQQGFEPQPLTIICSARAKFSPTLPFFQQPLRRWLWTTPEGAIPWQQHSGFEAIWIATDWDLSARLRQLKSLGIRSLGILGGGKVTGAFLTAGLLDELWITLCPLLMGNSMTTPNAVLASLGRSDLTTQFHLLSWNRQGEELFLHYCR
ncbi:MAG: RibD family protein [Synechococcaceae cyanobacterium SM2_3_1]|nr:RibD family protein [Synechococcaceae cyanobacterium SM2_3_1]